MTKKNKVNCKEGLDRYEEIQARKLRTKLENGDEEIIQEVRKLYSEWYKKPTQGFLHWLWDNGKRSLSSALSRLDDWTVLLT